MNKKAPLNCVRAHRRRWALTQDELAALLGIESRTGVSRIEQGERLPSLECAFALEVLFGVAPRTMFPQFYLEVEERVMRRALTVHEGLTQRTSPCQKRKSELLETALARATRPVSENGV